MKFKVIPNMRNVMLVLDMYETAIADGFVHFRKSDGKYLETAKEIAEAVFMEEEIVVFSPEMAKDFVRKVRFSGGWSFSTA